jgi:hypothetical protein
VGNLALGRLIGEQPDGPVAVLLQLFEVGGGGGRN